MLLISQALIHKLRAEIPFSCFQISRKLLVGKTDTECEVAFSGIVSEGLCPAMRITNCLFIPQDTVPDTRLQTKDQGCFRILQRTMGLWRS